MVGRCAAPAACRDVALESQHPAWVVGALHLWAGDRLEREESKVTRTERYERARKHIIDSGLSETEASAWVAEQKVEDLKLDARECPKCRSHLTRSVTGRQSGRSNVSGTWVEYRCPKCKYMCDRIE